MVVFVSLVAEAELAFLFVSTDEEILDFIQEQSKPNIETVEVRYVAPKIKLVNSIEALNASYSRKGEGRLPIEKGAKANNIARFLESGEVYLHHAQVTGARTTNETD